MATSGFSVNSGFTSGSQSESLLKRKVIDKAAQIVLLMDHTKLGRSLPFTFAHLDDVDVLICDAPLPDDLLLRAQAAHVRCLVAASQND